MAVVLDIGSNKNNPADDTVTVTVRPGDTVVVTNVANSADTLNVRGKGHSGGDTSTVAANANTSLTVPGTHYLTSASHSSVKITGGIYGV